ncbi:MAG: Flp family type IVb pilin [Alphaproteobacteria bacterium]|nr:MAG: Flp family type IVb pilin [Alphaproteobacteria bacterium]
MSKNVVKRIVASDAGSTAIEYALIAALIGVVCVGALTAIGGTLDTTFTTISSNM